jgi:hypothetical protein
MKRLSTTLIFVTVALLVTTGIAAAAVLNLRTHLSGSEEVPSNDSLAQGQAIFTAIYTGDEVHEIRYKLIVANIENVVAAHIHKGGPGVNDTVVVWLFPSITPGGGPAGQGRVDGVIAEGTITEANLINQGATQINTLNELIAAIQGGGAYVNVHTNDGIAPANTGPGDFPGGEIRGPIH